MFPHKQSKQTYEMMISTYYRGAIVNVCELATETKARLATRAEVGLASKTNLALLSLWYVLLPCLSKNRL